MPLQPTASVDGLLTTLEEGRLPLLDRGFLYGDSVYEVFRTYDGVPLFWEEHFDRLENSAELIRMPITQTRDEMLDQIRQAVATAREPLAEGEPGEVYVRYHLSRGVGPVDLYPDPELKTSFLIIVKPVPTWKEEHFTTGLKLAVTEVKRNADNALSPNIKSGNYLNNILALAEAVDLGADDCLMLNAAGEVTEASNSNAAFVIDGVLQTPPREAGILRGITGTKLREFADKAGLEIREATLTLDDLARAEEGFVTSATREVMPIASVRLPEGTVREFPAGGGPLTQQAAKVYQDGIADYTKAEAAAKLW